VFENIKQKEMLDDYDQTLGLIEIDPKKTELK